jgi:hypothetical protein
MKKEVDIPPICDLLCHNPNLLVWWKVSDLGFLKLTPVADTVEEKVDQGICH